MLLKNKYLWFSTMFVIIQQIFLAISTYYIAVAGESLSKNRANEVLGYITLFFLFALGAYFFSSIAEFTKLKLSNSLWNNYTNDMYHKIKFNMPISANSNKKLVTNWLTGEAPGTFGEISSFIVDIVSLYCNVLFTLGIFFITLGYILSSVMTISIFVSLLLIRVLRHKISNYASNIQNSKLQLFVNINSIWDIFQFGNNRIIEEKSAIFKTRANEYFNYSEKYMILEQFIACFPVYITIPLIMIIMYNINATNSLILGGFVAVLPRSLQLFGNVHSLSLYNSKILFIRAKYKNLKNFLSAIKKQDLLGQVQQSEIIILNTHTHSRMHTADLIDLISDNKPSNGRICISGSNGVGKSSLLKILKQCSSADSILLMPGVSFKDFCNDGSTGEKQLEQLYEILQMNDQKLLLDEWDANLDQNNLRKIDLLLDEISKKTLVIEIRHSKYA
ncbi:MAG: hypothetical protein K2Y14_08655 [Burkholderiales bacterium]|nr:hypothetical protein [Burkholderiales bacterium]